MVVILDFKNNICFLNELRDLLINIYEESYKIKAISNTRLKTVIIENDI